MRNANLLLLAVLSASAALTFCSGDSNGSDQKSDSISLESELLTPGNTVELATSTGDTVSGVTTDSDGDSTADGLDFNSDDNLDVVYLEGTLAKAAALSGRSDDSFAFRMAGSDTVLYFRTDGESIQIYSDEEGTSVEVTMVTSEDGSSIIGLNLTGDEDGFVEIEFPIYTGPSPFFSSIVPVPKSTITIFSGFVVSLSQAAAAGSITFGGTLGDEVGEIALSGNGRLLTVLPESLWTSGAGNLVINAANADGEEFAPLTVNYTVENVFSVSPASGSTISDSVPIVVTFGEALNTITSSGTSTLGDSNVAFSAGKTVATFTPTEVWSTGTLNLAGNFANGVALPTITLNYTVDYMPPYLLGGEPVPAQYTDITSSTTKVRFIFDESIDPASVSVSVMGSNYTNFTIVSTNLTNDTVRIAPVGTWPCLYDDPFTVTAADIFGNSSTYGPFLYGGCG